MTDEAPKPPPEQPKSRLPIVIFWLVNAAAVAAAVGASFALTAFGLPSGAATLLAMIAVGFAAWYLDDSRLNPNRDVDKDPFNRGFFTVNEHMLRAWRLRVHKLEWKEKRSPDLPPPIARAFEELLGVDPEVSVEADGLLWVAGERDWHDGYFGPSRFVIVGFDSAGKIKAADDLHTWPKAWAAPAGTVGKPKQS